MIRRLWSLLVCLVVLIAELGPLQIWAYDKAKRGVVLDGKHVIIGDLSIQVGDSCARPYSINLSLRKNDLRKSHVLESHSGLDSCGANYACWLWVGEVYRASFGKRAAHNLMSFMEGGGLATVLKHDSVRNWLSRSKVEVTGTQWTNPSTLFQVELINRSFEGCGCQSDRVFHSTCEPLIGSDDFISLSSGVPHFIKLTTKNKQSYNPDHNPGRGEPDRRALKGRHARFDLFLCLLQLLLGCWLGGLSVLLLGLTGRNCLRGFLYLLGGCLMAVCGGYFLIRFIHDTDTVPQKYTLTTPIYWGTVIAIGDA